MPAPASAAGTIVSCCGVQIGFDAAPDVVDRVVALLPPDAAVTVRGSTAETPAEPSDVRFRVAPSGTSFAEIWCDDELVGTADDVESLAVTVASLVHVAIANHPSDLLFVHAGAVAWRGHGVVIPGRTMSGKSTLVRALVELGAAYYSDEYAVLDPQGLLHPYARPISMRTGSGNVLVAPETLGPVGSEPVPVALVVSTRFHPQGRWAPKRSSGAATVLPLVENTVLARTAPERMLQAHAELSASALCLTGPRGDAETTAAAILTQLEEVIDSGEVTR